MKALLFSMLFALCLPAVADYKEIDDWFLYLKARKQKELLAFKKLVQLYQVTDPWILENRIPSNNGRMTVVMQCLDYGTLYIRACKDKCSGNRCNGADRQALKSFKNFCHYYPAIKDKCNDYIGIGERMNYEQLVDAHYIKQEHKRLGWF